MSVKQSTENKKGDFKKSMFQEVALKLRQAMEALKISLGEKKFEKRIKKAGKILVGGIKPTGPEKLPTGKIPNVKRVKKAASKSIKLPQAKNNGILVSKSAALPATKHATAKPAKKAPAKTIAPKSKKA